MYNPYNDNKYVDIVNKDGNCEHIDMNKLGFFNHSEGYYYYILENLRLNEVEKKFMKREDLFSGNHLENFLLEKGYCIHKFWIDSIETGYHYHFLGIPNNLTEKQQEYVKKEFEKYMNSECEKENFDNYKKYLFEDRLIKRVGGKNV